MWASKFIVFSGLTGSLPVWVGAISPILTFSHIGFCFSVGVQPNTQTLNQPTTAM
jgi:hypothetical protein